MKHPNTGKADQRNVTVSLPKDVLREARRLALDRGVSFSQFVEELLEERIEGARQYQEARDRQLRLLDSGLDLRTEGIVAWTREQLH